MSSTHISTWITMEYQILSGEQWNPEIPAMSARKQIRILNNTAFSLQTKQIE